MAVPLLGRLAGSGLLDVLSGLRMTNDDAARLARAAFGIDGQADKAAASALRRINTEVLGMSPVRGLDLANPETAAQALKSGMASRVASRGARNVSAFDRAIPDAAIGDVDWYTLGGMDSAGVGRVLGIRNPGKQRDVGAGIVARLSPKTPWEMNKKRAMLAAQAYKSGELDRFLTFVDNNGLWGKSLKTIREAADQAGIQPFKYISGFDTYQAREIAAIIQGGTGLASLKTGALAKKIDDFYGALRLSDPDREALKRAGVMDPITEAITDPDYVYMGQRLGEVPTGVVVDKIQEGVMLGTPQVGYKGFDLPLLDDPRTYRMQSDELALEAARAGKTPLRFQSDTWAKRHFLYPDIAKASDVVAAGGVRNAADLSENIAALRDRARRLQDQGLILPRGIV